MFKIQLYWRLSETAEIIRQRFVIQGRQLEADTSVLPGVALWHRTEHRTTCRHAGCHVVICGQLMIHFCFVLLDAIRAKRLSLGAPCSNISTEDKGAERKSNTKDHELLGVSHSAEL